MNKNAIIIIFVSVSIGLFAGYMLAVAFISPEDSSGMFIDAIVAIFSAFFGAWAAFKLQASSEKDIEEDRYIKSIRAAQFTLISQINKLTIVYRQILEPFKDDPDKWLNLDAIQDLQIANMHIDFSSLHFILEDDPELLIQLQIAEENFLSFVDAMHHRSKIHINEIQPVIEKMQGIANISLDVETIKQFAGPRIYFSLHKSTEDCYRFYKSSLDKSQKAHHDLRSYAVNKFKGVTFLSYEVPIEGDHL